MPTIRVLPEPPHGFRAVAGGDQATGPTVGQALDRLTDRLGITAALIVVQPQQPDEFFPADKRAALDALVGRWRAARDAGGSLPPAEQAELDALTQDEVEATTLRTAALLAGLPS